MLLYKERKEKKREDMHERVNETQLWMLQIGGEERD